jgi:hypothetical protein
MHINPTLFDSDFEDDLLSLIFSDKSTTPSSATLAPLDPSHLARSYHVWWVAESFTRDKRGSEDLDDAGDRGEIRESDEEQSVQAKVRL